MTTATVANLRKIPLFDVLRDDELDSIAPLFTVRAYPKNAIVVSEGEDVRALFFVLSGRTRHFWRDENGEEMDLVILGAGEWFGNSALIGEPMVVSSIAVEPLVVATISAADAEALLVRHPRVAMRYLQEHIWVIRHLVQRAKVFSMEGVYGRVVWLLQRRATPCDGRLVTERLTHADIARRVGATREMVGQVLRDLARGGYVAASGGRFTILKALPRRR
jgi:CRP/FNR family transcriptional regulator, cyclic AMP receptor protein